MGERRPHVEGRTGLFAQLAPRRLVPLAAWIVAVLGTALALSLATQAAGPSPSGGAENALPVRPPPAAAAPDPPDPGAAAAAHAPKGPPAADPADVGAAEAVLRTDGTFRQLLGGIPYRVVSTTPWTNATGDTQLGTMLNLQLLSPLSGSVRLPGVRFGADGTSYVGLSIPAQVTNATTLTVLVDLRSRQVVSAMPPDSTLAQAPGTVDMFPAPGGPGGN
jgi:hypothetical protein